MAFSRGAAQQPRSMSASSSTSSSSSTSITTGTLATAATTKEDDDADVTISSDIIHVRPMPVMDISERIRHCGNLFERRTRTNVQEFFRREPCPYNQGVYKNSARIFHCLKANLNENPILKTLRQAQQNIKERRKSSSDQTAATDDSAVTEVPRIEYNSNQERKKTLQLAFSILKFQKVLEDLLDDCQFYGTHPELKDEQSLVCTVLFDYMMRKFQLREHLFEEPLDNADPFVTQVEHSIYQERTDLAAELAKNRIRCDALTLDELLPRELREVDQHKAELPLYCWVNPLKAPLVSDICKYLCESLELKLVTCKSAVERKCFMQDAHCPRVLMFHYMLREKLASHELVRNGTLVVQDKSSCLAPYSVQKLLTKRDDVIVANASGGLVAGFLGCLMEEFEGRVYVYGAQTDAKVAEITQRLQLLGCAKYVKVHKEDFLDLRFDTPRIENVKVILLNVPCSKSALMNPVEFMYQEGEDVRFLRDYTLDVNSPNKLKRCVQQEQALLKHALRFPKVRAIVYQTYSKHGAENAQLVTQTLEEFNENKRSTVFPYKTSPPVIPLTVEDIKNDEVVAAGNKAASNFLQFKSSQRMNGCFVAIVTRDKDSKVDKEARKAEALIEKKTKQSMAEQTGKTFQDKNFLPPEQPKYLQEKLAAGANPKTRRFFFPTRKTSLPAQQRRRGSMASLASSKKSLPNEAETHLEREIARLQLEQKMQERAAKMREAGATDDDDEEQQQQPEIVVAEKHSVLERRLSQIGKLDSLPPDRSSTPTTTLQDENKKVNEEEEENIDPTFHVKKNYQFSRYKR